MKFPETDGTTIYFFNPLNFRDQLFNQRAGDSGALLTPGFIAFHPGLPIFRSYGAIVPDVLIVIRLIGVRDNFLILFFYCQLPTATFILASHY